MFISNFEKARIEARLKLLEEKVEQLGRSLNALHDAKTLSPDPATLKLIEKNPVKRTQGAWSEKNRAAQSVRMKKYWADKKAAAVTTTQPTQE
jgi:hypothetical protein